MSWERSPNGQEVLRWGCNLLKSVWYDYKCRSSRGIIKEKNKNLNDFCFSSSVFLFFFHLISFVFVDLLTTSNRHPSRCYIICYNLDFRHDNKLEVCLFFNKYWLTCWEFSGLQLYEEFLWITFFFPSSSQIEELLCFLLLGYVLTLLNNHYKSETIRHLSSDIFPALLKCSSSYHSFFCKTEDRPCQIYRDSSIEKKKLYQHFIPLMSGKCTCTCKFCRHLSGYMHTFLHK